MFKNVFICKDVTFKLSVYLLAVALRNLEMNELNKKHAPHRTVSESVISHIRNAIASCIINRYVSLLQISYITYIRHMYECKFCVSVDLWPYMSYMTMHVKRAYFLS